MANRAIVLLATLACGHAATAAEWQRDPQPLLTHFDNMYNPCVVETGGEYRFRMWLFGWAAGHGNPGVPGCDAIFHARSRDLRRWEVYCKDGTTIGIGAGVFCDGQVLVTHDLLGMFEKFVPSFVKKYAHLAPQIKEAVASFQQEVKDGTYPDTEHSFPMQFDAESLLAEEE